MSAPKLIRGFDYLEGKEVSKTSTEWKALTNLASRRDRVGGDVVLFDSNGRITHEFYDRDKEE